MASETVAGGNEVDSAGADAAAVGGTIIAEYLVESGISSIGEGGERETAAASSSNDVDEIAVPSQVSLLYCCTWDCCC